MKLASWNVNGLRSLAPQQNLFAKQTPNYWEIFLQAVRPDIFCLQEVKASPEQIPEAMRSPAGYSSFFSACRTRKGYSGVALYTKVKPLSVVYDLGIPEFDEEGRFIGAEYEDFWLLNVYFPNGGRGPERLDYKLRFYDAFLLFAEKLRKNKPVIFCGDINTAHEEIDLARPKENERNTGFLPEERAWLDEVVAAGYVDSFRHFHPHTRDAYSFWDSYTYARERNVGWRIDYFFVAREFMPRVQKAEIHSQIFGSDHCPVSIVLS
ncbi:exodeoxyribonuclease III [Candidatus Kaiserbacteria bacterium]|nr:exodeoxyribonuclease III [Candidatus Kaiserbacteria bacterium]